MTDLPPGDGALALGVLAALALVLTVAELRRYRDGRGTAHAYWAVGLALVAATLFEEAAFYAGVTSVALLQAYLVLVAVLVGTLSLGSAQFWARPLYRRLYAGYVVVSSAATAIACAVTAAPLSIIVGGVVTGNPPLAIVVTSSLVTFPAAAVMVVGSLRDAFRTKVWRLLYVAAGVIVISIAGGLYIAAFPITLYFAEFAGVFLLFLGFGVVPRRAPATAARAAPTGGT